MEPKDSISKDEYEKQLATLSPLVMWPWALVSLGFAVVLFCTCALPAALYLQCRFYDKDDHAACFPEALSLWAFWGRVLTPFVILNKIFQYATGLRSHSG